MEAHSQEQHEVQARLQAQALEVDREDLLALLYLRFGEVPGAMEAEIKNISKPETLERLIIVAANVPSWEGFVKELAEGKDAFRIVGDPYNPIAGDLRNRKPN